MTNPIRVNKFYPNKTQTKPKQKGGEVAFSPVATDGLVAQPKLEFRLRRSI
jgi:hypothetical protein